MKKDKLFNNKVNNQQLKDLNIEYRKRLGVASHVDFTWWETYGDKVFELGKKEALEDVEKILDELYNKYAGTGRLKVDVITEIKKRLGRVK
jgi:hypothetical protein